jgi:hypothetical protein
VWASLFAAASSADNVDLEQRERLRLGLQQFDQLHAGRQIN